MKRLSRATLIITLAAAWILSAATTARAQVALFDGVDWLMDRGEVTFANVPGKINNPPVNGTAPAGIARRPGHNNYNLRANDGAGNPSATDPGNNDPWHAVRRNVWPRSADLNILGFLTGEIIDNPNPNDPTNDSDLNGHSVRVQPRSSMATNNVSINMAHAYLNGTWTLPANVAPGAAGDYRSPAAGYSFSTDLTQVYTDDYAFVQAVHNDFLVVRPNGQKTAASQAELAALPYVAPEVYAGLENVLKTTNTAASVWQLGAFNGTPARFTIDIYSPGDGTIIGNLAHPNVTRAIVRVSYGHKGAGTPADPDVQTVDANGVAIPAGVNDSRYSRLYLIDLGQSGWINVAPGGRSPAAFDYNGDARYQPVVTLYTVTPDDVTDQTLFLSAPLVTADAVRFNPLPIIGTSPGLSQTADGKPVTALNPALYSIAPTGRILGSVAATNKLTNPPFAAPPFDITSNDTQPLVYLAREESVPNLTAVIGLDPTLPVTTANPLVVDPTLNVTAPVFYCLDSRNSNATKSDGMGGFTATVSVDRVRWRYVGLPDAISGSGTSSASPLLANVRCRDGILRPIVYFATTNTVGSVGHIYALDPIGNRQDIATKTNRNTTTAYWVYPSYRPQTAAELQTGQFPDQLHDPNYNASVKYTTGIAALDGLEVRDQNGMLAAPPWGADQTLIAGKPERNYVDGDIIANPAMAGHFIVRSDTQVPFTGMQSSPIVVDDPENINGAQILVVGGLNGRVYCFDAGGRGDFLYDDTHQNDTLNPATGIPYSIPGSTQRYWTWPHLKGDPFHANNGSGANVNGLKIQNQIFDEPDKIAFPASPSFTPLLQNINTNGTPFYIGGADGHMFALYANHDKFVKIDNQFNPVYGERRSWVYPNLPSSTADTQSLGAAPSTAAIFTPTGTQNPYLYFTCAGRVYCLKIPLGPHPLYFANNSNQILRWVFPFTNNPPFPNPQDSFSGALDPGFGGSAPVLVSQADLNVNHNLTAIVNPVTTDYCYVVGTDSTVYAIPAFASGAPTGIATGQTFSGATTRSSPILSLITGTQGLTVDTVNEAPTIVFSDDDGAIWGLAARPDPTQIGVFSNTTFLPVTWGHFDSNASRPAAAALSNGMIYEGGEDGQLRGYGIGVDSDGVGINDGLGTTLDNGERQENGFGISAAGISIDLRGLNLFTADDYELMTQANPTKTPARDRNGNAFSNSAAPIQGALDPNNGSNDKTTWPAIVDWGDGLYIAAYGVYHAQPQDNNTGTYAPAGAAGVPQVQVILTITQPGQPSLSVTLNARPSFNSGNGGVTGGNLWPDDLGITAAEHAGITIYGVDDPSGKRNMMSNPLGERLQGRNEGVFPFAVYYKLPILPDGSKPFTPGATGLRVTARAVLTQAVVLDSSMGNTPQEFSENSNFLQLGQHDYLGLVPQMGDNTIASATNPVIPANPNQVGTLGRRRDVIVTNPLAVTVRSYQGAPGIAVDQTGGNLPNILGMGGAASTVANPYEIINNGNRTNNPFATTAALNSPVKSLFAPLEMTPHGTSSSYTGVDNNGQKVSAFYVADRSNLAYSGPGGAGRHLRVSILTKPPQWLGGPSSVMNPLPWDLLPNDEQDTRDYPNLPASALQVRATATGQDAVNGFVDLTQPRYLFGNTNTTTRSVQPTEFTMTINVPKFQPANVNRGVKTFHRADGTSFTFGSAYTDLGGNMIGNGGLTQDILGPLAVNSGQPVGIQSGIAYPAGGYVGEVIVESVLPGGAARANVFNPQAIFSDSRGEGVAAITQAYRAVEVGLSVPPSIKMRVLEQTVDLGKQPQGAGVSDLNGTPDFRVPFSPSGTSDWPTTSPWDDENQLGGFFHPFTLVSEANVNLYDVRIDKLMGDAPLTAAGISPITFTSDQSSALLLGVPYLGPANRRAAVPGMVSSLDHISRASQNLGTIFPERPLWPVANPYVDMGGIAAAAVGGLQTVDAKGVGLLGWLPGFQAQPTVHKPQVGDTSGTIMTVPDIPHDAAIADFIPQKTKIGFAIPIGTPVGTYSVPVYPFEDNVPLQWQEWLVASNGFNPDGQGGSITSHDGAINTVADATTGARTPYEPHADPGFTVKMNVRESRITGGATRGDLAQIETFAAGPLSTNPFDAQGNVAPDALNGPFGFNMLPAAVFQPTGNNNFQIGLYWATPRQPNGSPYLANSGLKGQAALPVSDAPVSLAYSALFEGLGGWTFGKPGTGTFADAAWWGIGDGTHTFGLFPGYDGSGQPNNLASYFPSTLAEAATLNSPIAPGTRIPRNVRYASPSAVVRTFAGPPGIYPNAAQTAWLFWAGQIAKLRDSGANNAGSQFTDSRIFYGPIPPGSNGAPDPTKVQSMLNDPALPKLSPKPLLLSTSAGDTMYLFWHAGNGSDTQLYYNANTVAGFPSASWSRDTRLETPEALAWQSDPSPVYHQAWDPVNNVAMDVIDVVYTGVLKNRRTVETLLSRYRINPQNFSLSITSLPEVVGEQMSRNGNTFNYSARDAAWAYGTGAQGELLPTDRESRIKLYISRNYGPVQPLVPANKGFATDANGDHFPIGRYDPASGLIYYDSILGGQIVIDPRSGTVSFPQVAPGRNDAIYVSYTPMVMRLNTSRDETNIVRSAGFGNFQATDPAFVQRAANTSPGSNQNPIAIMERDFNERAGLKSPQVVFPANSGAGFPRLWVLYRKSDVSGAIRATLYYKAMRLMARLPRPVALTNNNGDYSIKNLTITGNVGPYEVDWVRGRVYFTELDEGRLVTINYAFTGGQSGNLVYRVAWGDEISSTSQPADPNTPFVDETTPEVALPTDSAVNEGQVTAFQIPASLRTGPSASGVPFQYQQGSELWVFWTSTRAGTTDLFYETVRPNFYPNATNQR